MAVCGPCALPFRKHMAYRVPCALSDIEPVDLQQRQDVRRETHGTILELKYLTPDDEHIMGIEYYQAVIADGVRTYSEFMEWRKTHPANGIVNWCP